MSKKRLVTKKRFFIPEIFKQGIPPQGEVLLKPSRLEVIKEAVMAEGLTEYSAKILSRCHRLSTIRQYQSVWRKFLRFLQREKIEHWNIGVVVIVNFLSFHAKEGKAFRTLFVYKNALRLPLLFKLGLNIDAPILDMFMRGMFNEVPPDKDDRMPKWDVNIVLKFLLSKEFCPPEKASFFRLEQKTFFLTQLGAGRRCHEICNLSVDYRRYKDRVTLLWPDWFKAKNHNVEHAPSSPSIKRMSHFVKHKKELYNCPVANWEIYIKRRLEKDRGNNTCLWTRSQAGMSALFKLLVLEALTEYNCNKDVAIRPHQVKKLSVSLCGRYWSKSKDLKLEQVTGNKSYSTLLRYYLKSTPKLKVACSLPLGTAPPKDK